ncbi:MAG: terminase small subunit [Bdellovibrio sp.]
MGIPLPPGIKKPEPSIGPDEVDESQKLNEDEVSFILRSTLLREHYTDPNVIRWIHAYIRCREAKQAALEVGLPARAGENLKRRPDIQNAITAITNKAAMKYGYDAAEVVEKVKEIAFIDPIEFENPDGTFKESLKDISPEARRAIKKFKAKNIIEKDPNGFDVVTGKLIEVELYDKTASIKMLGSEKDLFAEKKKIEHDVSSDMKSILLASTQRAEAHKAKMLSGGTPVIDVTPKEDDSGADA